MKIKNKINQMKYIIILTLSIILFESYGQTKAPYLESDTLGQLNDGSVKAFQSCDNEGNCIFLLKFKKGKQNDTLRFAYNETEVDQDSLKLKSLQIDGKGLNEIIISWTYTYYHTAMWQMYTSYSKSIEIWNLDTHKKIFSANPSIEIYASNSYSIYDSNGQMTDSTWNTCSHCKYSYNLNINNKGQIIIENIETNISDNLCDNHNDCDKPDHQEGLYIFKDGQYILNKN